MAAPRVSTARDFWLLLKPNVMQLVVFTGWVGLYLAPGRPLHPILAFTAILCIAVGAGAAAAINNWFDADIDRQMARTRLRPTASGAIEPSEALALGITLSILSVSMMGLALNWTAGALLALTIAFYVFVYTFWLKRRTPQNIVIGGAAGAFPPMVGWAAATGHLSLLPILLFLIVFMWTPPHFWALALYRSADYAEVSVPMLPVVAGRLRTRQHILAYAALLLPLTAGAGVHGRPWPALRGGGRRAQRHLPRLCLAAAARRFRPHRHEDLPLFASSTCSRCSGPWRSTASGASARPAGGL